MIQMIMKKPTSTIGWVCVICFLSCLVTAQAIASNMVSVMKEVKLEELVQKLETANPWTAEKVSEALGLPALIRDNDSYIAYFLDYGEGLMIRHVKLQLNEKKDKMIRLTLDITKKPECFTLDHMKKMYPDMNYSGHYGAKPSLPSVNVYKTKRSWGSLFFNFTKEEHPTLKADCLFHISLVPNE